MREIGGPRSKARYAYTPDAARWPGCFCGVLGHMPVQRSWRGDWRDQQAGLGEQGRQDYRRQKAGLKKHGRNQRFATHPPLSRALLGIAFHQTTLQGTQILPGHTFRIELHHTPPQEMCERLHSGFLRHRNPACFCRSPAPRSQGCEVARVLAALDTNASRKFLKTRGKAASNVKISQKRSGRRSCPDTYFADSMRLSRQVVFGPANALIQCHQAGRSPRAPGEHYELSGYYPFDLLVFRGKTLAFG